MTPSVKKTVIITALLLCGTFLKGQNDSLVVDSITVRIKSILQEYNSYSLYVDTSDYVHDVIHANDINLQTAASMGACNEIIRLFIKGADVNNFIGNTATPLHYAVNSGKWEAVEILLLLGADPSPKDMYGNTPLITAVRANDAEIAEKLIRHGSVVTETDRQNSAPLHHAAALGNFLMADMLLYYDSPADMQDNEGNTPLMTGVCLGYQDITDLLLQSGADPNAADRKGFTPLMAAAQNGDTLLMRMLIDAGANLYAVNTEGLDALGGAILSSRKEAVAYLLDTGSRWNRNNGLKTDPLTLATNYGRKEIVQLMTDRGMVARKSLTFSELSFSAGGMLTTHCQMAGGSVSVADPGIRTGFTLGAASNPLYQRMLVKTDEEIFYQYRVKSNMIYAGLFREFLLNQPYNEIKISAVPAINIGYRFHSLYEGTEDRPDNSIIIMPAADLRFSRHNLGINAGVTYAKMPFYKTGPVWFTLKVSYTLAPPEGSYSLKKLRLYNYE